jgi:AcrR family transcriptional regulator
MASASRKRTNQERRGESEERILDAAERLFARRGYNGVSLKEIASEGEVDASLLHYYFATKDRLFNAVLARRAEGVNRARDAALKGYEQAAGDHLTPEGVVRAYIESTFGVLRSGGDRILDYLTIVAQLNSTPAGAIPGSDITPFDEVVQRFITLLERASPSSSRAELYWFYHMLSGAITLTWSRTGRIDRLSGGMCRSDDFDAIAEQMIAVFGRALRTDPGDRPG